MKACQVPQSKLHIKLLQATKVIIALVKEKKQLAAQLKELTGILEQRKTSPIVKDTNGTRAPALQVHQSEKGVQTTRNSPRGHVQWSAQKPSESRMEQSSPTVQSEPSPPLVSNRSKQIPNSSGLKHKQEEVQILQMSHHGEEEEQQLDISLASLKFTDSSLGESSLHHVLQMVERELSSSADDKPVPTVRHSTPEPAVVSDDHKQGKENSDGSLKLVGSKVVPLVKKHGQSQEVTRTSKVKTQNRTSVKPKVRNYNIKD